MPDLYGIYSAFQECQIIRIENETNIDLARAILEYVSVFNALHKLFCCKLAFSAAEREH